MLGWLKKFFRRTDSKNMEKKEALYIPPETLAKIKVPRQFEIFVEEFDEDKEP